MLTTPSRGRPLRKRHNFGNHEEYLSRISKSLYYVKLPAVDCTSYPVTELASELFSESKRKLSLEYLSLEEAATLSRNACVSPCSLVLALLYLDRLKASNPKYLAKVSPSELFLISLMIGSKFLHDDGEEDEVNNCEWAASAGLTVQDVNRAEKEFLRAINWEVFVGKEEFWRRLKHLEGTVGLRQAVKRGWFSYTELELLLDVGDFASVVNSIFTVMTACLASYLVSVLALVGSAMIVAHIPGLAVQPNGLAPGHASNATRTVLYTSVQDCNTATVNITDTDARLDCHPVPDLEDEKSWIPQLFPANLLPVNPMSNMLIGTLERDKAWHGLTSWPDIIRSCILKQTYVPNMLFPVASF